ncbi:MAG: winged helix-turn-helix domain-containing protein [Candidatus Altiarchaeota archaeon]
MDVMTDLGFAAGEIYQAGKGTELNADDLKKKAKRDEKTFYMALGWLAREGKASIRKEKKTLLVTVFE